MAQQTPQQRDRQREYEELVRRYERALQIVYQARIEVETEKARLEEYQGELTRLGVADVAAAAEAVEQYRKQYDEVVAFVEKALDGFESAISSTPADGAQRQLSRTELLMAGSK